MPLSADPDRTAEYWLATDEAKPVESRPVFICRFMTYGEHRRVRDFMDKARALPTGGDNDEECGKLLENAIKVGVVGWRNFPEPFSIDAIFSRLTPFEVWELADSYRFAVQAGEIELKKSATLSTSATTPIASAVSENQVAAS